MAKKCMMYRELRREYPNQVRNRCRMRQTAGLYAPIWIVQDLLPRISTERPNHRRYEIILVIHNGGIERWLMILLPIC